MSSTIWLDCLQRLQEELAEQQFNTWIRPLQAQLQDDTLYLYAPNRFVLDWVKRNFFKRIAELTTEIAGNTAPRVCLEIGSSTNTPNVIQTQNPSQSHFQPQHHAQPNTLPPAHMETNRHHQSQGSTQQLGTADRSYHSDQHRAPQRENTQRENSEGEIITVTRSHQPVADVGPSKIALKQTNLNPSFVFENFVEGNSNQLARAASMQVADNPGGAYNPLFIYGGVGLGKTHLMHAVGNHILQNNPNAKVLYLHSERFVADMVKALQTNAINEFKRFYRSLDALLIDDIQFFAGKDRSQEEFFHTFNALLEGHQQIILTSDRYPKEIDGVEERLKSRFGWGLTVAVEPPELETRVAILMTKAEQSNIELPYEVAFFIGKRIRSNVRELEGALRRVIANAQFTGKPITIEFAHDALRDLLALQDKLVTIENIIKTVAEYYKIKVADILSKRRSRSVARPRQMAMALAKELTSHSLPEIGDAFGGRDHTTVIHACRKIKELIHNSTDVAEDYKNLLRTLST